MTKNKKQLKCLFVSSEVVPFAKTGGLADVAGALPAELITLGLDVRVVLPYYRTVHFKLPEDQLTHVTGYNVSLGWRHQYADILYKSTDVPTYFIKNDHYFNRDGLYGYGDDCERFAFFCKVVAELICRIDFVPDIVHCNDWQTGPISLLIKDKYFWDLKYQNIKCVFTIHNMKYQGLFGREVLDFLELNDGYANSDKLEFNGGYSFMKAGLLYADHINTVSPTYMEELKTPTYGCGLDNLLREQLYWKSSGIINGIDTKRYNPKTDPALYYNFDINSLELKEKNKKMFKKQYGLKEDNSMLVSIISRLTDQKGFDLMKHTIFGQWVMDKIMELGIQFVVLGTGDQEYENMFRHFKYLYPDRSLVFLDFNEELAQKIYAASDVFLMPSYFEPCGLGQLMAMRYGAVPIVRQTGGLKDTVIHYNQKTKKGTGFEFVDYAGYWLYKKIEEANNLYHHYPTDFKQIQLNAMSQDFAWEQSAKQYIQMYEMLI
ncbi:glycogen synthase GlgA [Candidatus Epulonipiscium viviparus]|uniref:glycogen synthase GlgA n=1 Tax=Candidatus Epulonipiscium viviparus TaxID=420336 RepID=UPI00016C009B|nr:glycogen synthase GlgA [Candidatus Epulopiscium viviparus]